MNYYDNQRILDEIYDALYDKLNREPTQDEIDEELYRIEGEEPDWDAMAKDDKLNRMGDK